MRVLSVEFMIIVSQFYLVHVEDLLIFVILMRFLSLLQKLSTVLHPTQELTTQNRHEPIRTHLQGPLTNQSLN